MNKAISIIICFYNAGTKLIPTIKHIKELNVEGIDFVELILVNNNSNDDSENIINKELGGFNLFHWEIVFEGKPGLSNARVAGIEKAKGAFLLFCDDDNWLDKEYIQRAFPILEMNENIAVLGGYGSPVSDTEIPEWFYSFENSYAVGRQRVESGKIHGDRNVVYGAGMIVNRDAFYKIHSKGFSFKTLGRTGQKLSSGEDSELCLAFQIAGYDIWYDEQLLFKHYIEPRRLTERYLYDLKKAMSTSGYISRFYRRYLFGYKPKISKFFWLKELIYTVKYIMVNLFRKVSTIELKRNLNFLVYLVKQRKKYNENVKSVLSICQAIDSCSKEEVNLD